MKKTKFMRAALLLLVLTLITSCFVGGTFAKYTTSTTGNDSARVAKWGFEATDNSIVLTDLFKNVYKTGDAENVRSNVDVIAPGTENSVRFSFAYDTTSNSIATPEVAYTFGVAVDTTGSNTTKLDDNASFKWTLDSEEYNTFAELTGAIKALSGDDSGSKNYAPGQLPTDFYGTTVNGSAEHSIGWKWAFDGQDVKDTELGNMDTLENISIKITVTATQID